MLCSAIQKGYFEGDHIRKTIQNRQDHESSNEAAEPGAGEHNAPVTALVPPKSPHDADEDHHNEQNLMGQHGSEEEEREKGSPFEEAIENLSTPDKLLPIINNLTLLALVILHLPAAVPTILIPLAFFCVGSLLIPIVRVNYFINHKDDGEDGR